MRLIFYCTFLLVCACKPKHNLFVPDFTQGPPTIVYKTNADYYNHVPVLLSLDKKEIIGYPHPSDIKFGEDGFQLATRLIDGYLLDNRGIWINVAFLKYTYKEYAELKELPTLDELYGSIIEFNPIVEMCNCGSRAKFKDVATEIEFMIKNNQLKITCKVIKK